MRIQMVYIWCIYVDTYRYNRYIRIYILDIYVYRYIIYMYMYTYMYTKESMNILYIDIYTCAYGIYIYSIYIDTYTKWAHHPPTYLSFQNRIHVEVQLERVDEMQLLPLWK